MDDITLFSQNGFVIKKKLFTRQEIEKLKQQIEKELVIALEKLTEERHV